MKILFRVDASEKIGAGHLLRCLALANGFKDKNHEVLFLINCDNTNLLNRVNKEHKNIYHIPSPLNIDSIIPIIKKEAPQWVVLDGYQFNKEYQLSIKNTGTYLLCIDDNAHLDHYCADIILNQNYGATKLKYSTDSNTELLLGSKFVLLRNEFARYINYIREIPQTATNLLITMGGADIDNYSLKILEAVNLIELSCKVRLVVGASNPHYVLLKEKSGHCKHNTEVLFATADMASLMEWADIAISAGGTTIWELAYMKLPVVLCIVADNQQNSVNAMMQEGYLSLGWIKDTEPHRMKKPIEDLLSNYNLRCKLSNKGREIVDGEGVSRVVKACVNKNIKKNIFIRKAEEKDIDNIFKLSNQNSVRKHSFKQHMINYKDHVRWFNHKLSDKNCIFLVAESEHGFLGQVRFDIDKKNSEAAIVSISIDEDIRGHGFGPKMLRLAMQHIILNSNIHTIRAYVIKDNLNSHNLFTDFGFRVVTELTINNFDAVEYVYTI